MTPSATEWVTKSDITGFVRCPYTYWRRYMRMINFDQTVSPFAKGLITAGVEFEAQVRSRAIEVAPELWWEEVWNGSRGFGAPNLRNEGLGLFGRPDGLTSVNGVLVPMEVKSHRRVQSTDELEVAFYWLLLQPYQRRQTKTPRGQLILRAANGSEQVVDVVLRSERLAQVEELISKVRSAREHGVEPEACGCDACRDDPEVMRLVRERHHVSLIFNVGPKYSTALKSLGVATYEQLLNADPLAVSVGMRGAGHSTVTLAEVARWQQHAESYVRDEPVIFGDPLPVGEEFIALDAEYDDDEVWLIGLCTVRGDRSRYRPIWADTADEQRRGIRDLRRALARRPGIPVVTWGGISADLPTLKRHLERLGLKEDLLAPLYSRHVDALDHAKRSVRFPIPRLGLKDVEEYLDIKRRDREVHGGADAMSEYRRYRRLPPTSPDRVAIRQELTSYNRDDLRGLIQVVQQMRKLALAAGHAARNRTAGNALAQEEMFSFDRH